MALSKPLRVDDDLMEAAKTTGAVMSRSAAQQINHWARIGRELENSTSVRHMDVVAVLSGARSYDEVGAFEQALIRVAWEERMSSACAGIAIGEKLGGSGDTWTELDADGNVVNGQPPTFAREH